MARPWISLPYACAAVLTMACAMDNPAFDENAGNSETGSTTQSTTDSASSTASSGEESASNSSSSTTDPEEGMEAPDPPEDMEPEQCIPSSTNGLFPRIGTGLEIDELFEGEGCPDEYIQTYVRVHEQTDNGDWLANLCPENCSSCPDGVEPVVISAHYLELALLIPPSDLNLDLPTQGCYWVQAEELLNDDPFGECIYASMSIFEVDEGLGPLVFNANRESWGPTAMASQFLFPWEGPIVVDQEDADQCLCDGSLDIDCCEDELVVPKKFKITDNDYVYPGNAAPLLIDNNGTFMFYGAQAQSGVNCEFDGLDETSWALHRTQ